MLDVSLIFKIAAVSILIIILDKILETTGKKDYAIIANLAGIIIVLMMVINLINKLFSTVRTMFQF
ncbi:MULTISPECIES: stage III sporulation protein AC [Clostridium]|jgi:stage III sporulation protein AC|uniref:Stage III sporulation protein AC/AD protein family protein n=3 Tax=Clostridium TaxID=1485 RepID=A0A151AQG0_9CLOT|nr:MULTISPECIES: stage III sporulation protein AC [Clostridium]MBE6078968.1 stage III sporulation protein AC [Clostridium lundense]QGU95146.1 stage III sporulation protein AC [Clostridium bovifaecis]KYH29810.1 stage III sporulation protein AC/AD protein family protein [Clostridium colicanis DSM 13634]MBE6042731.1 stage III sporulation protein AC [Clostridium thermopalmarium]PRR75191.1 Stage III sporulation protein AC/AD protein family protein [Clostridium thermopalmarium DSM 5974]